MHKLALAVFALIIAIATAPTDAEAQSACDVYRVKRGDSLREITRTAYGDDNFRRIYRANRSEIGRNPNIISVGIVLRLPCLDGTMPNGVEFSEPKDADSGKISFVTANGYLPYTDESLTERGLFTHLVSKAMLRAEPETPFEIVFINDWAAHLEALLPSQAFDASFPWTEPGCETQGTLTKVELFSCQNFVYSDPFYEIVDGFFSRKDAGFGDMAEIAGFKGSTICRPEGYPTGHLDEMGLAQGDFTLVQPTTSHACFRQLMSGDVDLVALDTRAAEHVLQDLGLTNDVIENPHLYSIEPLRIALTKSNPKSDAIINALNTGLEIMLQSGEWASIVSDGLKDQPGLLVN